jgi:hypothetical protein
MRPFEACICGLSTIMFPNVQAVILHTGATTYDNPHLGSDCLTRANHIACLCGMMALQGHLRVYAKDKSVIYDAPFDDLDTDRLYQGQQLTVGGRLTSPRGKYYLELQVRAALPSRC